MARIIRNNRGNADAVLMIGSGALILGLLIALLINAWRDEQVRCGVIVDKCSYYAGKPGWWHYELEVRGRRQDTGEERTARVMVDQNEYDLTNVGDQYSR